MPVKVQLDAASAKFSDHWSPKVAGEICCPSCTSKFPTYANPSGRRAISLPVVTQKTAHP